MNELPTLTNEAQAAIDRSATPEALAARAVQKTIAGIEAQPDLDDASKALFVALYRYQSYPEKLEEIGALLKRVPDVNAVDATNQHAPTTAYYANTPELVDMLAQAGVNFNTTNRSGHTPLAAFLKDHRTALLAPDQLRAMLDAFHKIGADFTAVDFNDTWGFKRWGMGDDQIALLKTYPFNQQKLDQAVIDCAAKPTAAPASQIISPQKTAATIIDRGQKATL